MSNFPSGLEALKPFIQRANEFKSRNPLVSYYCRTYAAQLGIDVIQGPSSTKEQTTFVLKLMDDLESEKEELNPDAEAGKTTVALLALTMFGKAEQALESGRCDKTIAKIFYTSSVLMDVCKQFGELEDDMLKKQKYARWRAAQITKAANSGETIDLSETQATFSGHSSSEDAMETGEDDFSRLQESFNRQYNPSTHGSTTPTYQSQPQHQTQPQLQPKPQQQSFQSTPSSWLQDSSVNKVSSNIISRDSIITEKMTTSKPQISSGGDAFVFQKAEVSQFSTQDTYTPQQTGVSDDSIDEAQKLTKYALSALQFYDVPVAVQNLKDALRKLGYPC